MEAEFKSNYEEIGQNIIEIFMHRPVYHMSLAETLQSFTRTLAYDLKYY